MLGEARSALITSPHTSVVPGLMIFVIVVSINLLGDGIRDALDPRLRSGALSRPLPATPVERHGEIPAATDDLLAIQNLQTEFRVGDRTYRAVNGVSLAVRAGECVGVIGESGSGKSVTALAVMGLVAAPAWHHYRWSRALSRRGPRRGALRKASGKSAATGSLISSRIRYPRCIPSTGSASRSQKPFVSTIRSARDEARKRAIQLLKDVRIPQSRKPYRQLSA